MKKLQLAVMIFKNILGLSTKFDNKMWEQIIKTIDINGDGQVNINLTITLD